MQNTHSGASILIVVSGIRSAISDPCETGTPFGQTSAEDEDTMKNLFATYRANAAKRALYRQTRDEIANMPRSVALDLGFYPEDAARIAHKAVWG
jgi:hypothetical protein